MGLFDYAMDMGKKLFDSEDEGGEKIQQHIEKDNPGISGLLVKVKDGVASLFGKSDDPVAVEKAILMAGNVVGVKEVKTEIEAPPLADDVEYYVIVRGDTLSGIAKRFYGKASLYPKIFEANREVIKDPDLIYPGQKIRIPKQAG
ncbi:MAG: peptidoglycan-binding protein LysM [Gammaproteobacteria bacterium]|nr:peptidoglycan-binding protein LysM [Gammaproteobacteria bacterium]